MRGRIFLSYASEDRRRAGWVAEALMAQGWSVWWDQHIPAGRRFDEAIADELRASDCVVVLWSSSSVDSDWVKDEAAEAAARGALVPVLLDEVAIPLGFRRIQAARLVGWDGAADAAEFLRLREAIAQALHRARQPSPADMLAPAAASPNPPTSPREAGVAARPGAPSRLRSQAAVLLVAAFAAVLVAFSLAYLTREPERTGSGAPPRLAFNVPAIEARLKDANVELSTGTDADRARVRGYFTGPDAAYYLLAVNILQILRDSRLAYTGHLDMIDKWYTSLVGAERYVGRDGSLDHDKLKEAIVRANNEYHGQSAASFEEIVQPTP